jgi:hypothetical protein
MKRIAGGGIGLMLLLSVTGIPAGAQNQAPSTSQSASSGQSLGDYARHVRKTPESSSKPKVFDNDNLPRTDKLSVVGKPESKDETTAAPQGENPTAAAPAAGEGKTAAPTQPASSDKAGPNAAAKTPEEDQAQRLAAWKQWGDKIKAQQQQADLLARELDVLQREYQIRAAAMYADAGNRLRNQADWDKQDAQYKQQIADKQKAVDDAKQKIDELREQAHRAGVPDSVQEQ